MGFNEIKEIIEVLVIIGVLIVPFYLYYTNKKARGIIKKVLPFLPRLLAAAAAKTPDKKGVFDKHDFLVVLGRLTEKIQETIDDPENISFYDVKDELYEFVKTELDRYKDAGVSGVPDVTDESIRTQINIVFRAIKQAQSEDSAGNDS